MKIEIDTKRLKATKDKLMQQVADNPLGAAAVGAGILNGTPALMNAFTKRKIAKTEAKNAQSWDRETRRRDRTSPK